MPRTPETARTDRILAALRSKPGQAASTLREGLGADFPRQSLTRYLARLVAQGELLAVGKGKGMRYFPADLSRYLALPAATRGAARFVSERVGGGLPRFSAAQLKRLHAAGESTGTVENLTRAVKEQLLVELSWASSALEGNTYSMLETQVLIAYGQAAEGKPASDTQMILNHRDAVRHLLTHTASLPLDYSTVRDLHALLSDNLLADPADSGRIRKRQVFIGNSSYSPLDNEFQLREALDDLLASIQAEPDPFNRSLMLLVGVAYAQPFVDCNKRTGRVLANLPLLQARRPPLSFVTVDKQAYLQGLIAYYELGLTAPIAACYVDGYLKSADAYRERMTAVERDPALMALETRYRGFLRERLRAVVLGAERADAALPDEIPIADRQALLGLIAQHLVSLHEGRAVVLGLTTGQVREYLQRT